MAVNGLRAKAMPSQNAVLPSDLISFPISPLIYYRLTYNSTFFWIILCSLSRHADAMLQFCDFTLARVSYVFGEIVNAFSELGDGEVVFDELLQFGGVGGGGGYSMDQ